MTDRISLENIRLSVKSRPAAAGAKPSPDTPFRILVMGDFSGRESRGILESLAGRRSVSVDVDNLDQVLARIGPKLELEAPDGGTFQVSFRAVDDFHPDRLAENIPSFKTVGAGMMVRSLEAGAAGTAEAVVEPAETTQETLARLLGKSPQQPAAQPSANPAAGNVEALIKQIVGPHVVASPDPAAAANRALVDHAMGERMRAALHQPSFQKLEAAWRGIDFLVRGLETDESLQLRILDVSKAELTTDLCSVDDLAQTETFKTLVEETVRTPGGEPWAAIVGLFAFGPGDADAQVLARLGKIAAASEAPFLAAAGAEFVEAALSDQPLAEEAWSELRKLRDASSIGLVAPRFLLRLPYGKATEAIESFPFEEAPDPSAHETFLWGNPALACAALLGQTFRDNDWDFEPGDTLEVTGLPVHTWTRDGEATMTPCAERWLTDRHAGKLLALGIMPLLSIRGRDAARLVRFQSVADPPTALAGRWR